jgi:hypothetical protein
MDGESVLRIFSGYSGRQIKLRRGCTSRYWAVPEPRTPIFDWSKTFTASDNAVTESVLCEKLVLKKKIPEEKNRARYWIFCVFRLLLLL